LIAAEIATMCAGWLAVLVRQSLYALIVLTVVFGLSTLLGRRSPALQLALWSLVLIRLVLPLDLGHPLSVGALIGRMGGIETVDGGMGSDGDALTINTGKDSASLQPSDQSTSRDSAWPMLILLSWLSGVSACVVRFARHRLALRRLLRRAHAIEEAGAVQLAEKWSRRFAIRRRIRLVTSGARMGPLTTGVIRPVIYIPRSILESDVLEPVIAHEMAHVARWDGLWLLIEHVVRAFYFFHPAVWIATARIDRERERLCDAMVLAGGTVSARAYAGAFLEVLHLNLPGAEAPALISAKRRARMRLQDIISTSRHKPRAMLAFVTAMILGVFLLPMRNGHAGGAVVRRTEPGTVAEQVAESPVSAPATIAFTDPLPDARVTRGWGESRDPFTGNEVFHRGIDLAASTGTSILAAAAGVVEVATTDFEPEPGAGTVIVLKHADGFSTFYSHIGSLEVGVGQEVFAGEVIATVGSTGKSTGPHLHFEIRENGQAVDPADFIEAWQNH
jgi:murein DD-endopeptidase MepM/ murein hydrolase activator NlpD